MSPRKLLRTIGFESGLLLIGIPVSTVVLMFFFAAVTPFLPANL